MIPATAPGVRILKRPKIQTTACQNFETCGASGARLQNRSKFSAEIGKDFCRLQVLRRKPGARFALHKTLFDPSFGKIRFAEAPAATEHHEAMAQKGLEGTYLTLVEAAD